ncbi:GNAT family N-acetyltransferase [Bacillus sp. Marseille-Q3570]|uniref:GNAT family N-acetyltransferase n=1 Tax=Bacillus sp. Marseille-Q3570 TaxID=2963522 RepID=UPI0021B75C7B|nr:GNAT family N-acetyltransferase [Bacillus sp. Marseille-Q3570]
MIKAAEIEDLEGVLEIDREVIGHSERSASLEKAIREGGCFIAKSDRGIAGFLIYDTSFFECSFISLVIVHPSERRKGVASRLIENFEQTTSTEKVFSSTNESNLPMAEVFSTLGYRKSGYIDNLDEGDPEIIYFKKLNR